MTQGRGPAAGDALAGIGLMSAGVAFLSANDAIGKVLTAHYPAVQILFLRNLIALPVAMLIAWRIGGPAALRTARPLAHLVRGALWLCAAALFFTGLGRLGLAEATAILFAAPIFITALSALVLKERVGRWRWGAVGLGFAGVLVVVRPGGAAFQPAALFPLGTAFVYAALMISARWVDPRESVVDDDALSGRRRGAGRGIGESRGLDAAPGGRCVALCRDRAVRNAGHHADDAGVSDRAGGGRRTVRLYGAHLGDGAGMGDLARRAGRGHMGRGGDHHGKRGGRPDAGGARGIGHRRRCGSGVEEKVHHVAVPDQVGLALYPHLAGVLGARFAP
ncbi:DMT family transporter [Palleronia rufa]